MELILAITLLAALVLWLSRGTWMAALTADREVDRYADQLIRSYDMAATTVVYKGAFVGNTAGYARGLVAGDRFWGIATEQVDNDPGAAGDKEVECFVEGDFKHALTSAAVTDIGKNVYASDDNTLTLNSAGNSYVGFIVGVPAAGEIVLRLAVGGSPARQTEVVTRTADLTLTQQDSGKIFNNLGATGAVVFSLPAAPPAGLIFHFVATAAQEIRVDPGASDAIFISGAKQADGKYVSFDDEAEHMSVVSNTNGDWIVFNSAGTFTVEV